MLLTTAVGRLQKSAHYIGKFEAVSKRYDIGLLSLGSYARIIEVND
jgi:hypothetical protein